MSSLITKTNIVVFGKSELTAVLQTERLLEEWSEKIVKSFYNAFETEHKLIRSLKFSPDQRVIRYHEVYVDQHIDEKYVEDIIIPRIIPKREQIENLSSWDWKSYIHYY
ncbi:hypothetical protein EBB07_28580 [Paenibacillaceae bacterium]|nr:hypothetical protein EBB07_28580 [Paenibacillaceae bacterium]